MRMNKILQSGLAIVLAICLLLPGGFFSEAALAATRWMAAARPPWPTAAR